MGIFAVMIDDATVQRIFEVANIYEVVSDFVSLKKRGANYTGCCPFHNEKTPSFSVSPAKGIYKCFGCGRGGNAVNFIMEHEQISYLDALKYLAKKYGIQVEERELSPEQKKAQGERESMLLAVKYASDFFTYQLHNTEEGRTIGLSYFEHRGLSKASIEKFGLGYSPQGWDALTKAAIEKGYKQEFLVKTGLTINHEKGLFDRFRTRVIFPIHDIAGKVIGFGGRTMSADKNVAKYLNSPESVVYHKSNTLYGIYHAKKSIVQKDRCYMVEGYLDVITMHARGLENTVASSGTSLTVEQIRLLRRLTNNITIIYDGDAAGIKASIRGIDLVLEEGLNVRVVPLPEGEDPDTFAGARTQSEIEAYIATHEVDFISFKTQLLLESAANDPVERARLTNDIVHSIALIPDGVTRSLYVRETSIRMRVDEALLYGEMTRARMQVAGKSPDKANSGTARTMARGVCEEEERLLVRYLIMFGNKELYVEERDGINQTVTIGDFITRELGEDELEFMEPVLNNILKEYRANMKGAGFVPERFFATHVNTQISSLVASIICEPYELSKIWNTPTSGTATEESLLTDLVPKAMDTYKMRRLEVMTRETDAKILELQAQGSDEILEWLKRKSMLDRIRLKLNAKLKRTGIH
ncbi:MAG: DNA primase [Marinifilaceae bacterium]